MPYQEILANWRAQLAVIQEDTVVSMISVIYTRAAATSFNSFGFTLDSRQFDVWNCIHDQIITDTDVVLIRRRLYINP